MAFAGSAAASIFQIPERVDDPIVAPFPELLEGHAFGMSVQQRDVDPVIVNRGPGIVERKFTRVNATGTVGHAVFVKIQVEGPRLRGVNIMRGRATLLVSGLCVDDLGFASGPAALPVGGGAALGALSLMPRRGSGLVVNDNYSSSQ